MNMTKCAALFELGSGRLNRGGFLQYLMVKKALRGKSYRKSEITEGSCENSRTGLRRTDFQCAAVDAA